MPFRINPPRIFLGRNPAVNNIPSAIQDLMDSFRADPLEPLQGGSGYVLITRKSDPDDQYLGRKLEFDINRGFFGKGDPEQVLLDGHPIFETQIRFASRRKLQDRFFDEFDIFFKFFQ